jgi:hypothetical protein
MPTLEWRGGGSTTAFSDKTNWIDSSTGGTPASAPANGDTFIFNQGAYDVPGATTGLTGVTIIGTPGYSGRIGTTTALDIAVASLDWDAGALNLAGNITAASVHCRTGVFSHSAGTIASIYLEDTEYDFAADSEVTALRAFMSNGSDQYNATGYTTFEQTFGSHVSRRSAAPKIDNGKYEVGRKGTLLDGTDVRGEQGLILYASSEDIASGQEVIVRPYASFSARPSAGFAWDGELTEWNKANVNLITAAGEVDPSTHNTYGRSQGVGGPIAV